MTGIYSPPLLAEELKEIVTALRERAQLFELAFDSSGVDKAKRQARGLRQLAKRLEITKPQT